jgi:hypothetical protein
VDTVDAALLAVVWASVGIAQAIATAAMVKAAKRRSSVRQLIRCNRAQLTFIVHPMKYDLLSFSAGVRWQEVPQGYTSSHFQIDAVRETDGRTHSRTPI